MPATIEEHLTALGTALQTATSPITGADVRAHRGSLQARPTTIAVHPDGASSTPRGPWRWVGAAAALAASIAGIVVLSRADERPTRLDDGPSSSLPASSSSGAMTFDPTPDGWELAGASPDRLPSGSDEMVHRLYTGDVDRLDTAPAFDTVAIDQRAGAPAIPSNATTAEVQGVEASLWDDILGRTVAFQLDDTWLIVTGHHVTDDVLLLAAEHARLVPTRPGIEIDPVGLPPGVEQRGIGIRQGHWFISQDALASPIPVTSWSRGETYLSVMSLTDSTDISPLQRLGVDAVADAEIRGEAALVIDGGDSSSWVAVSWHEHGRTYLVEAYTMSGGTALSPDDLLALAEQLRPASNDEWTAMQREVEPPAARQSPETGLPAPGSLLPRRVTAFPAIADDAVPDFGAGPTYASYGHGGPGIFTPGTAFRGVLGRETGGGPTDLILVTVSDRSSADQVPVEPGRTEDVGEHVFGDGAELVRDVGDHTVIVLGRHLDLLYTVVQRVEPIVDDLGALDGYRFGDQLPDGLTELVAPVEFGWASGATPTLQVHNGALTIDVSPDPALLRVGWVTGSAQPVTTSKGSGYVVGREDSNYHLVSIDLGDGSSLALSSANLTLEELLAAVDDVELLDETTWRARYRPMLPIVPRIVEDATSETFLPEGTEFRPPDTILRAAE